MCLSESNIKLSVTHAWAKYFARGEGEFFFNIKLSFYQKTTTKEGNQEGVVDNQSNPQPSSLYEP